MYDNTQTAADRLQECVQGLGFKSPESSLPKLTSRPTFVPHSVKHMQTCQYMVCGCTHLCVESAYSGTYNHVLIQCRQLPLHASSDVQTGLGVQFRAVH